MDCILCGTQPYITRQYNMSYTDNQMNQYRAIWFYLNMIAPELENRYGFYVQ